MSGKKFHGATVNAYLDGTGGESDVCMMIYWLAAATLTACVTYTGEK